MLVIKSLPDLKKYLETRKKYTKQHQKSLTDYPRGEGNTDDFAKGNASGMIYALEEAIKAVEALMQFEESRDNPDNWLDEDGNPMR